MVTFSVVSKRPVYKHKILIYLRDDQYRFFNAHEEINRSDAARQGIDFYIAWYNNPDNKNSDVAKSAYDFYLKWHQNINKNK